MATVQRVLVIGGGVGGLSAATAFAQRGVEVTLIERRDVFDVPGVGLGQPANALRAYDKLGLLEEVLSAGFVYDHMTIFDKDRNLIAEHKFLLGDERVPAVCALSRLRLHEILLAGARKAGVNIRLGTTVTGFQDEADGLQVEFSDGTAARFDLAAGFDGIRSTTRLHVVGTAFVPRPSGYGAWRIQVPRPHYVKGMEFLQGVGSKTGAMPLSNDLMYLFHIRPERPDAIFDRTQYVELLQERWAQFGSYVADVSRTMNASSDIVYGAIEPMLVPWPWFKGRVVLGGDAAHTFPPHLTQGAAMAVEDALVLAHEVLSAGSLNEGLAAYSKKRYARCAFVYTFAKQWLDDEQSIKTNEQMDIAQTEMALNASARIAVSDRILNSSFLE